MAYKRIQCKVLLTLFLIINTCFAGVLMEGDSLLVRENAHIEKLLMLDVTNEAMEADSILVKATDNYICNFPILKLPFFTESEIDSILLGKADTGHVHDTADVTGLHDMLAGKSDVGHDHDTSDVTNLSLYLGQKLNVTDTSDLARKVHDHSNYLTNASPYNTNDNTTPFKFTRQSNTNQEYLNIGISDLALQFNYNNDEPKGHIEWRIENTDTETGDGTNANTTVLRLLSDSSSKLLMSRNNGDYYEFWHSGNLDPSNYYTKANLSTSGQSSVHWGNITDEPAFITGIDWDEIGGTQSDVNVSGFNNDAGYLDELPSHNHDTRYYTKTDLQTSGQASVHAGNITNVPWLTSLPSHNHDTRYPLKSLGRVGTAQTIKEI